MDNLFVNSRLRIKRNVVMHLKRHVPGGNNGTIRVSVGQEVFPEDILGEGQIFGGFRTVHLAHELDVSPKQALSYLNRGLGQKIYQGEILASRKSLWGLQKKVLLSPVDGLIDFYDEIRGELRIKLLPRVSKLVSGVYGIVDQINEHTGTILVRSLVDLVYGVFGSGKERDGILRITGGPETLISSKQITSFMSNEIVVGGGLVFLDAIEKAITLQVAGIITGGINAKDFRAMSGGKWNVHNRWWSDVGISLMVTEGFGSIPIGKDVYEHLKQHDGRFVIMDGNRYRLILPSGRQESMMYIRRLSLPIQSYVETIPELEAIKLKIGDPVRIVAQPYVGVQGVVMEIDKTPTRLPSGIATFLVTVDTASRKLRIPYLNLEVVVS